MASHFAIAILTMLTSSSTDIYRNLSLKRRHARAFDSPFRFQPRKVLTIKYRKSRESPMKKVIGLGIVVGLVVSAISAIAMANSNSDSQNIEREHPYPWSSVTPQPHRDHDQGENHSRKH